MKTIRLSLLALAISAAAYAQPEATMYTLRGVPQFTNYNPAFVPNYKFVFSVGAPSVFASYANNGFSANDALTERGDSTVVDIAKFQNALAKRNYINVAADAELLRLGIKMGARLYTNFSITGKVFTRVMVPKDLTALFVNGTADFINGTATLAPELEALAYMETALGASYVVNRKLTVGGRVKVLTGLANGTTENTSLTLSLADNYAMTVRAQVDARSSGIQQFTNGEDFDIQNEYKNYFKNVGLALDMGATYKLTDKFTVGASVLDLGGITWKNNNYGYTLSGDSAKYTFPGIDLNQLVDNNQDYLEEELDSVAKNFEPRDGVIGNYRTPLPTKMYFTAQYDLKHKFSVSGLLFFEKFRSRFSPGFSVALHKEVGRLAGVSLSYTATNRDYSNLGLGFNLNLGFLQFYLTGDNLLQAPLSYVANGGSYKEFLYNLQFFNVRTGLNFVFGRVKEQEKSQRPTYNKRKK